MMRLSPDYVLTTDAEGRAVLGRFYVRRDQRREPNFQADGRWYLVRCFTCGRANYMPAVASGRCVWCGDCAEEDTSA